MTSHFRAAIVLACLTPVLLSLRIAEAQASQNALIPNAPPTDPVIASIIEEGKNHSHVMDFLHHIAVDIGPRLTGSRELENGERWALGQFQSMHCDNVHREKWGDIPGFERGPVQIARMVSPIPVNFQFTTNAWTDGTTGDVKAIAVDDPTSLDQAKAMQKQLHGAWVLMPYKANMGGPSRVNRDPKELTDFIDSCGIAGRVFPSRNELVNTNGSYRYKDGDKFVDKTPANHPHGVDIMIRKSDMEEIHRWMAMEPVTLEFNIQNKFLPPMPVYNVIADIKGTEKPDEMVIISGHFDSWNGPGSEGANDNGTGASVAMEAARILTAVHAKPKRTIRFILWSGEEQGLLGSRDYVEKHKAEMDKISAVIVDDGGTGYHGGYSLIQDMVPLMSAAVAPLNNAFPDMPDRLVVTNRFTQEAGSDHDSFLRYAVPAFFTLEGGNVDYDYIWHSQNDRIENSVPKYLVQSATDAAAVAYSLANADTLLPRTRKQSN